MKQLVVEEIVKGDNITRGYAVYEDIIVENLRTIFSQQELKEVLTSIDNSVSDYGNRFVRFYQFIVYLSFRKLPKLSFGMVVIDCYSDVDAALDEYLMFNQNDWDQPSKDAFMNLFQEIQDHPTIENAVMVLQAD